MPLFTIFILFLQDRLARTSPRGGNHKFCRGSSKSPPTSLPDQQNDITFHSKTSKYLSPAININAKTRVALQPQAVFLLASPPSFLSTSTTTTTASSSISLSKYQTVVPPTISSPSTQQPFSHQIIKTIAGGLVIQQQPSNNISENESVTTTMKGGDVATAALPAMAGGGGSLENRSPMINIPAGIVKEFMSVENNSDNIDKKDSRLTSSLDKIASKDSPFNKISIANAAIPSTIESNNSKISPVTNLCNGKTNGYITLPTKTITSLLASAPSDSAIKSVSSVNSVGDNASIASTLTPSSTQSSTPMEVTESTTNSITSSITTATTTTTTTSSMLASSLFLLEPSLEELPDISNTTELKPLAPISSSTQSSFTSESSANLVYNSNKSSTDLLELTPVQLPNSTATEIIKNNNNSSIQEQQSQKQQPLDIRNGHIDGKENSSGENALKRSLPTTDTLKYDTKKQRLSPPLTEVQKVII